MGGGLESSCVGRVYGADGDVHGTIPLPSPLEKVMGRRKDLLPTTHNTHKRQPSIRPAGMEHQPQEMRARRPTP